MLYVTADDHFDHGMILRYTNRPWGRHLVWRDQYSDSADTRTAFRKALEEAKQKMNAELVSNWNDTVKSDDDRVYVVGDFAFERHGHFLKECRGKKILIVGSHDRLTADMYNGFMEVHTEKTIRVENTLLDMHHTCMRLWEKCHYGSVHLFGHSHGRLTTYNLSFDVGVDTELARYAPIPLKTILEEVERRRKAMDAAGRIVESNGKTLYRQDDVAWLTMGKVKQEEFDANGELIIPDYGEDY